MSIPLIFALAWLALMNVVGMFPSKHHHWPQAYALMAVGIPVVGWVFLAEGPWVGAFVLLAASSVFRWPLRYFVRWLRRLMAPRRSA